MNNGKRLSGVFNTLILSTGLLLTGAACSNASRDLAPEKNDMAAMPPLPETLSRSNFIAALDEISQQGFQYVYLAESGHSTVVLKEFKNDKRVLQAFKDHNFNIMIDEGPAPDPETEAFSQATLFNRLKNGSASTNEVFEHSQSGYHGDNPEKSARCDQADATGLINMAQMGFEYHEVDPRYKKLIHMLRDDSLLEEYYRLTTEMSGDDTIYSTILEDAFLNTYPGYRPAARKFSDFLRYSISAEVHATITQNIQNAAGNRKAVIRYGHGHEKMTNDIDDRLGKDKCAVIVLFSTPADKDMVANPDNKNAFNHTTDLPQYFYIISTDEMVRVVPGADSEKKYREKTRYSITRAEYNAAVAKLPEEYKGHELPYEDYDGDLSNDTPENKKPQAPVLQP